MKDNEHYKHNPIFYAKFNAHYQGSNQPTNYILVFEIISINVQPSSKPPAKQLKSAKTVKAYHLQILVLIPVH